MSLCAQFLSAARKVAKQRKGWTDRGCAVLDGGGDYRVVEDFDGVIVWEGEAHCRYCARAEAITYLADPEHLAKVEAKRVAKLERLAQGKYTPADVTRALKIVGKCEASLKRRLSPGEIADLLGDQTTWAISKCHNVAVAVIANIGGEEGPHAV